MENEIAYTGGYAYQKLRRLGISEENARLIAKTTKIVSFKANEFIWKKGDSISHWYLIINGMVSVSVTEADLTPIALYGEGTWFGEFSILSQKPAYANFISLVSTDMLCVDSQNLLDVVNTEPVFASKLAKLISWRAQKTSETLTVMKFGNPPLRVIVGLCQFVETLAYSEERPPTIGFGEGIVIPLTQSLVAALCGVSRTVFSEIIQQLANEGWINISYGKIEILDLQAWRKYSHQQRSKGLEKLNPSIEELLQDLKACSTF